jgi:hypothetical protein
MGYWGTALYSGDFAMDLRAAVAAVARLPLADDELVAALRGVEPGAAEDAKDPDHTVFWLVLAEQLARRGIFPAEVRERAMAIIDGGADLEVLKSLGAGPGDLRKRQAKLAEIRAALVAAQPRPRKRLSAPQPFVMRAGEVIGYPTSTGSPVNPYFKAKPLIPRWSQDGWAAAVVVECGRAFGYLAWYRLLTVERARPEPWSVEAVWAEPRLALRRPGTCSPTHRARMELETLGEVGVDFDALARLLPEVHKVGGRSAAVSDVSIANSLKVAPLIETRPIARQPRPTVALSAVARPVS